MNVQQAFEKLNIDTRHYGILESPGLVCLDKKPDSLKHIDNMLKSTHTLLSRTFQENAKFDERLATLEPELTMLESKLANTPYPRRIERESLVEKKTIAAVNYQQIINRYKANNMWVKQKLEQIKTVNPYLKKKIEQVHFYYMHPEIRKKELEAESVALDKRIAELNESIAKAKHILRENGISVDDEMNEITSIV